MQVATGETAEADYVSSAYAVTTAVATARSQVAQVEAHWKAKEEVLKVGREEGSPEKGMYEKLFGSCAHMLSLVTLPVPVWYQLLQKLPQLAGLDSSLESRLSRVSGQLCRRLRAAAADLMARLAWPPPLAPGAAADGSGGGGQGASGAAGADGDEGMFDGFEQHPVLARRLVGVLTALTHHQVGCLATGTGQQVARERGRVE